MNESLSSWNFVTRCLSPARPSFRLHSVPLQPISSFVGHEDVDCLSFPPARAQPFAFAGCLGCYNISYTVDIAITYKAISRSQTGCMQGI